MQIVRTKAENALIEGFERVAGELAAGPDDLKRRQAHLAEFARLGLPGRRVEAYKYTNLKERIEVLAPLTGEAARASAEAWRKSHGEASSGFAALVLDGRNDAGWKASASGRQKGLSLAAWSPGDDATSGVRAGPPETAMSALASAYASGGVTLSVAAGTALSNPVHLGFVATGSEPALAATNNRIVVEAGARAVVVEQYSGPEASRRGSAIKSKIRVEKGARLDHVIMVAGGSGAVHLETTEVTLGEGASYRAFLLSLDTLLIRHDINVMFAEEHATIDISGLMLARGREHIDTTLVIDHARPHGVSRELFKAVILDTANAVFQGKVIVRPDAQKTDGKQMAQALMLSPSAEFDSKPELEIYADDVVCGHGSTVAELDEDMMFYCRSRGIPRHEARKLLIESFVGEATDRIEPVEVRELVGSAASGWLDRTLRETRAQAASPPARRTKT